MTLLTKISKTILFTAFFCISIFLIFILGLELFNYNKIIYGVNVGPINISRLTQSDALNKLKKEVNDSLLNQEIILKYTIYETLGQQFTSSLENLGLELDFQKIISKAYQIGKQKNLIQGLKEQIFSAIFGITIPLEPSIRSEKFEKYINDNLAILEKPPKDANLIYNNQNNEYEIIPSEKGFKIDREELKSDLLIATEKFEKKIPISILEALPEIKDEEAQTNKLFIENILKTAPYKVVFEQQIWEIDRNKIIEWLEFEKKQEDKNFILSINLNKQKVEEFLNNLKPNVAKEPRDAILTVKNNKVIAFAISQDGIDIDMEKSAEKIKSNILNLQPEIILETQTIKPKIATDEIENLGITSLLGIGVSDFKGSPKSRVNNIKIGSSKFNGVLIKPQEEFSFNKMLGNVGPNEGYQLGLVIKTDKMTKEYGGGLCQVSTTTFRAAINSGLKITARNPHSIPVAYYNPQGFDATIYPPSPDLKFINDTPSNVLIQTKIQGTKLYFEFYGTSDGRETKVIGPEEYDKKADGSLKARLTQEVYKNGELLRKKTFYSFYKSPKLYPIVKNPLE